MTWIPFGADESSYPALVDGIPPWLESPLAEWFMSEFYEEYQEDSGLLVRADRMRRFDFASRATPYTDHLRSYGPGQVWNMLREWEKFRFLDWLIRDNVTQGEDGNEELEELLRDGGSKWRVGVRRGEAGLEERVAQGVAEAAESVMATPGHAGELLSAAWHSAFGVSPDPERAYSKAIKAVEAAAIPVVSPNNTSATLGSVLAQMRDQRDWKLELTREESTNSSAGTLLGMVQTLWKGQNDRHAGAAGYTASTRAEAEAAVMLAVPLVQWFGSGAIARR
ncbi:hypothetical protein [Microbacterium sp. Leaf320]|uniref:hypothetical protein n=1 Tax=Microbacterium sp. Leaf320 TaxID=1736334 RepID=UPI000713F9B3|nr:hypothetical protein [Microbacterium sp. Leaf320]KQQ68445.1 hypothetical protein ASF63_00020 [Microbacterium sp. Leaf320]